MNFSSAQRLSGPTASSARVLLAVAFVAIMLAAPGAAGPEAPAAVSVVVFAIALGAIAAASIGWDRTVGNARAAGLVEID